MRNRNHVRTARTGAPLWLFRGLGIAVLFLGAWAAIVPYIGPLFGYPEPAGANVPAWQWTAAHWQLHLAPGVVVVIGALLMLAARRTGSLGLGSLLALAGGAWLVLGPVFDALWMPLNAGGAVTTPTTAAVSRWMQVLTPLGYHYGTGLLIAVLATFGLRRPHRRGARVEAPEGEPAPEQRTTVAPARRGGPAGGRVRPT